MRNAAMMVVTVVELVVSTQNTVQNVYVMKEGNQCSTFHVSDLLMMPQKSQYTFTVNIGCESDYPHYVGNGYCIDQNNNEGCLFDGGDCCGPNVNTEFCTLCVCHEDFICDAPMELIGNGLCNDEANNEECNYDGGDCCGANVVKQYCIDCDCLSK